MSQPHPILSCLHNMEGDISDLAAWSELLFHVGSSASAIEPAAIKVIAGPLAELGRRLEASWLKACDIAGGEA